jgi:hypothetical protein
LLKEACSNPVFFFFLCFSSGTHKRHTKV